MKKPLRRKESRAEGRGEKRHTQLRRKKKKKKRSPIKGQRGNL